MREQVYALAIAKVWLLGWFHTSSLDQNGAYFRRIPS